MQKIREIIIEPTKVYVDSTFKIKIKARKYLIYEELKSKTYNFFDSYRYNNLKGE